MPEPSFNETLQIGIVVRDLEGAMRRYVDDYGIGPWEIYEFDAGEAGVLVDVDGDAAAVVADADGAVHVDGDFDASAEPGEVFVDGVVQNLGDAVVEGAFVGAADIHAGLLAHGLQSLELAELVGTVGIGARLVLGVVFGVGLVGHLLGMNVMKSKGKISSENGGRNNPYFGGKIIKFLACPGVF